MKTQISNLINGSNNIIRDMENQKYTNAKQATSHVGYAGTNRDERHAIATMVHEENPNALHISVRGFDLTLPISYTTTGKTWQWGVDLTQEQYIALGGTYTSGNIKSYTLVVFADCTAAIYSFTKKSQNAQWRQSNMTYLDESFITIL